MLPHVTCHHSAVTPEGQGAEEGDVEVHLVFVVVVELIPASAQI